MNKLKVYLILDSAYLNSIKNVFPSKCEAFMDRPHEALVVFQDFMSVKLPMSEPREPGVSLGNLVKEIVEINKTLCSLDLLVLFHQGKSTR